MMRNSATLPFGPNGRSRGSIFFLVVALLGVVVLLATTLIYVAKLENLAANNAAKSVQARMASVSGLAAAIRALSKEASGATALTQPWANGWQGETTTTKAADGPSSHSFLSLATVAVMDESSRLNVNAVEPPKDEERSTEDKPLPPALPEQAFKALISQRLKAAGLNSGQSSPIAEAVLASRIGRNSRVLAAMQQRSLPASSFSSPRTATLSVAGLRRVLLADLRRRPYGDDTPVRSVAQLRTEANLSDQSFQTIAPYVTTFSSVPELWYSKDEKPYVRMSLNDASPVEIHDTLKALYPEAEDTQLAQFAVNIVDRRDTDSLPTAYSDIPGVYPIIGAELNPVVSEVCPVVISEDDSNAGQYVEIYNPLSQAVSLRGWRVDWGTGQYVFSQTLGANAFLIITNNIDNSSQSSGKDSAPGMGSFFDVFRILPSGTQNQIVEEPSMSMPGNTGMVSLYDPKGHLIDYLLYKGATFNGISRGFQKRSLFSHLGDPAVATPFKSDIEKPSDEHALAAQQIFLEGMNKPFTSPAELLAVPDEYLQVTRDRPSPWSFPALADSAGEGPDVRLLDAFTVAEVPPALESGDRVLQPWDPEKSVRTLAELTSATVQTAGPDRNGLLSLEDRYRYDPTSFGKVNINTASPDVLSVVPGVDSDLVSQIMQERDKARVASTSNGGHSAVPFTSMSDFAVRNSLWGSYSDLTRLRILIASSPLVSFNSSSFAVAATNRPGGASGKRQTLVMCSAQVQVNASGASVVSWGFVSNAVALATPTRAPQPVATRPSGGFGLITPVPQSTSIPWPSPRPTGPQVLDRTPFPGRSAPVLMGR